MKVVILVPRRDDNGWRDHLWAFCKQIWQREFPDWPIFEGYHEASEGPFNRSLAINRAAGMADSWVGGWDVALIIDSDTISEPDAVRRAVQHSWETGHLSIAHHARHMMSRRATEQILTGADPAKLTSRQQIKRTWYDSVSCAVAVRRLEWDTVGGFDINFEGWGFEDTAFRVAIETVTDHVMNVEQANCYHLWHESSPEASNLAPTYYKNQVRKLRYERAHFHLDRLKAIFENKPEPIVVYSTIPHILHRTVPAETSQQVEDWWQKLLTMHPGWEALTWRDPINPGEFPLTGHLHDRCSSGAQKAGLIRLELLVTYGGVYVDSDVEGIRPLDALTYLPAFAAWEDEKVVPDAVLGASPGHPAFREMLHRAIDLVESGNQDAWATGPGITTAVLPWRDDVLLLPPGSFYPVHYKEKHLAGSRNQHPWVFLEHKWHHSWASAGKKAQNTAQATASVNVVSTPSTPVAMPDDVSVAVCMPWVSNGDPWRQHAHDWCQTYWAAVGLPVFEGGGHTRSVMCNTAAAQALEADKSVDVLIFADADTWVPPEQLAAAVTTAVESGQLVHAFTTYVKLDSVNSRIGTRTPLARIKPANLARTARSKQNHVSGMAVVPVELWKRIGGFDPRFVGWGFEDQAFHLAAEVMGGGTSRVSGHAFHWYHRGDPTKNQVLDLNDPRLALIAKYCQAAGYIPTYGRVGRLGTSGFITVQPSEPNVKQMQDVLSEVGGPLSPPDAVS